MRNTCMLTAATIILTGFTINAHAHRTWLLPSSTQVEGKEPWVTVDAAVSENLFDFESTALKLDGLRIVGPDGAVVTPENTFSGRLRSSFDIKLAKPGTYRISLVTEPVMANYKLNGETKRWRGTADMLSKEVPSDAQELRVTRMHNRFETFVTAGKPNDAIFKMSGAGLELSPVTHPNELIAGEKARFRFLMDGKPAANLTLSIVPGGVRYRGLLQEILVKTDDKGEFSVTWPQAGMYWINASYPPRQQQQPERRLSYGGTVEVLPH